MAHSKDMPDRSESPALTIIEELAARGAEVPYDDPHVPELCTPHGDFVRSAKLAAELLNRAACARLVVDTRNSLGSASASGRVHKL